MNKRKRTGRIALALLISGIVFLTNTIAMLLTIVAIYGLARLGVIETTGGQVGLPELLRFFFYTSLVIGFLLASLTGKIILKPIKRIIDQLDRLASGDFKTRLHFGKPIADHPTFKQVEKSFNRAAEELDYTEMLRSDFINNFSHEFKTPIHSIKGMAEYLLHNEIPREEEKEYLNVMAKEAGRLAQLSQNTLLLSKLEHMEVFRKKEEFRLDSQIRDCAILLLPSFEEKNILLEAELPEMKFYGSEEFMKEVWVNLLDNARKYSPEGTRVFIEGKVTEKDLWITVRDEGQGMDEQTKLHLFERYYQGDDSHETSGFGLGLSIVKRIVELSGGSIRVESRAGKGTSFFVYL